VSGIQAPSSAAAPIVSTLQRIVHRCATGYLDYDANGSISGAATHLPELGHISFWTMPISS